MHTLYLVFFQLYLHIYLPLCQAASTLRAGVQYPPCTQIGSGNSSDGTLANTLMKPLHSRHGHFLAHDPL